MSSAYIDQNYLNVFLSEPQVTALLSYGGNTSSATQQAKANLLISGSSSVVDSFLQPAGYSLPLSSVPEAIKKATCYLVLNDLYASANQPIPETISNQVSQQYAYLNLLREKKIILENNTQDIDSGTGANTFNFGSSEDGVTNSADANRIFSLKKLRGSFF